MIQEAEAVIIGAGAFGTSIAFHLAKRGRRVALLEPSLSFESEPGSVDSEESSLKGKGDSNRLRGKPRMVWDVLGERDPQSGDPNHLQRCHSTLLIVTPSRLSALLVDLSTAHSELAFCRSAAVCKMRALISVPAFGRDDDHYAIGENVIAGAGHGQDRPTVISR